MIELQQEAIFLFLLFWNKMTGVKIIGQIIGHIVWEGRYDSMVKKFGEKTKKEEGEAPVGKKEERERNCIVS